MISKPQRGDDILAHLQKLWEELQPVFKARAESGMTLRKGPPAWIFGIPVPAATRAPWAVYVSPDAEGAAAWRTVRVHSGTINGLHPVGWDDASFSDDTAAAAADMDMELDAGTTVFVCALQTRHTAAGEGCNAWDIAKTYLFFTEADPAFPGAAAPAGADVGDIFRNAYYRTVAKIEVGSDDEEAEDFQQLTITQILDADLVTSFAAPAFWEPVLITATPNDPGADEWRKAKLFVPGFLTPAAAITNIGNTITMTAGAVALFWLKYTLDQDTGEVTAVALASGATLPEPTAPDPGQAPAAVYRLLASVQVPEIEGQSVLTMAVAAEELAYQIVTVGWDVNESGAVVNLYAGYFS